jgi:hypothetical protein
VTVNLTTRCTKYRQCRTDTPSNIENIIGSAFNDTLTGTAGANLMDGNDSLIGLAGDDINAGAVTTASPAAGNDALDGGRHRHGSLYRILRLRRQPGQRCKASTRPQ